MRSFDRSETVAGIEKRLQEQRDESDSEWRRLAPTALCRLEPRNVSHRNAWVEGQRLKCPVPVLPSERQRLKLDCPLRGTDDCRLSRVQRLATQRSHAEDQGIPEPILDVLGLGWGGPAFGSVVVTEAAAAMAHFKFEELSLLVLCGPPRTGKSVAAAWWAWDYEITDGSAIFRSAATLARTNWYQGAEINELYGARGLVVDDLGVGWDDKSGFLRAKLNELLATRYDSGLRTIVATNLTPEMLGRYFDDRVLARLRENGMTYKVTQRITPPSPRQHEPVPETEHRRAASEADETAVRRASPLAAGVPASWAEELPEDDLD